MGCHEPLTSLALGRSPYDDVVDGEGEADPREPTRQYDEHGRVVNEESKRMNRDIIRAHNEVMLVIGVAEQEPGGSSSSAAYVTKMHNEYENVSGMHFLRLGRFLVVAGIWGVHGVRQRILVYKDAAKLPFLLQMRKETKTHSVSQFLFAGIPSFLSAWSLQWYSRTSEIVRSNAWLRTAIGYVRFHLQIYVTMQRLDLIPGSRWFPGLNFFIPFSSSSPFKAPPPLGSPGAQTLSEWAGQIAMSLAPYAGYYLMGCTWDICSYFIRRKIHKCLPHPWPSSVTNPRAPVPTSTPRRHTLPELPTAYNNHEDPHWQTPEVDADAPPTNGESAGEALPVETPRRQGTFSSRGGDDYATDEEDAEMLNPTLISFDVDTSESTEPPPGVWSAELRPSNNGDPRSQQKDAPRYVVNTLTSLPSLLAGDILTSSLTHVLLTPFDILTFRAMARAYSDKFRLPTSHMFEASLADGLATRMTLNLFQAEVLKFVISFAAWALVTGVAQRFHYTEEEWKEYQLGAARIMQERGAAEQAEAAEMDSL
ncbi:hypothetical protein F4802DRAFT_584207 [Xylaria palmicola]|nr:hypothetical protein F4802DRAFT_584207 [Xylaria palmicola]